MERILKYIETNICEPLTSKELAEIIGYSESHFNRLFKENMNMTCMRYIWKRRLIRASEDIANGSRIIDVAFYYGWQSHSAFTKSFKREFGFCPSLLRIIRMQIDEIGGDYMKNNIMMETEIGTSKEELLTILKTSMKQNGVHVNNNLLNSLYLLSCKAYDGMKRYSGEEYVTHTINVSIILSEMGAEENVILAGMLCDVAGKGRLSFDEYRHKLPSEVFKIVSKLETESVNLKEASEEVVQIKLAERLHNMRTIDYIDDENKVFKVRETTEIYMPLARKIGNVQLINELNALIVKYNVGII